MREGLDLYFEIVRAIRADLSVRRFAAESGINESTAARLFRSAGGGNVPSLVTHRQLVDYAKSRGMTTQAVSLERIWDEMSGTPESPFQQVFGREIAQGDVSLVLPTFRVNKLRLKQEGDSVTASSGAIKDDLQSFLKAEAETSDSASTAFAGIGVDTRLAAYHDLGALLILAELVRDNGITASIPLEADSEFMRDHLAGGVRGLDKSAIVVGLHNNALSKACTDEPGSLIQFVPPGKAAADRPEPAVDRKDDGAEEDIEGKQQAEADREGGGAIVVDGQPYWNSHKGPMYFVIARVLADPVSSPDRVCLICAGTRGTATLAAARHLRGDWEWFLRFRRDQDFAVVYSIASKSAEPTLEFAKSRPRIVSRHKQDTE